MKNGFRELGEAEAVAMLSVQSFASLAAAAAGLVDNAVVCVTNLGLRLYFGALEVTLKCRLIARNSLVALTIGNLQYHGRASMVPPGGGEYAEARRDYDSKFPSLAWMFGLEGNHLYRIEPLAIWRYDSEGGTLDRAVLVRDGEYFESLNSRRAKEAELRSARGKV